jgi:hypothetical protein
MVIPDYRCFCVLVTSVSYDFFYSVTFIFFNVSAVIRRDHSVFMAPVDGYVKTIVTSIDVTF